MSRPEVRHTVSRRQFFRGCLAAVAATGFSGCMTQPRITEQQINFQNFPLNIRSALVPFVQDLNPSPSFRAGSLLFFGGKGFGHGSVISKGGEYFYYSVKHVADITEFIYVPGIGFVFNTDAFFFDQRLSNDPSNDVGVYKPVGNITRAAINNGMISPLLYVNADLHPGNIGRIPRSDTGRYTEYMSAGSTLVFRSNGRVANRVTLQFINRGAICGGRSGNPVVSHTPDGIGVVYGAVIENRQEPRFMIPDPVGNMTNCSTVAYMRPNN